MRVCMCVFIACEFVHGVSGLRMRVRAWRKSSFACTYKVFAICMICMFVHVCLFSGGWWLCIIDGIFTSMV